MKIHLVDGTYELFRNHFGAPPKKAPDGRQVGATLGLVRSMLMLVTSPGVTHVACAFDHVIESFRNDLFTGYKTSSGVDAELLAQFPSGRTIHLAHADDTVETIDLLLVTSVKPQSDGKARGRRHRS